MIFWQKRWARELSGEKNDRRGIVQGGKKTGGKSSVNSRGWE